MWILIILVAMTFGLTGFLVGVAYGQEHKDE